MNPIRVKTDDWVCAQIAPSQNWVRGEFMGFAFEAKIYCAPSEYGIDGGQVSKLYIRAKGRRSALVQYDRGWDIGEDSMTKFLPLLERLEKFAQRPDFAMQFSNPEAIR